MNWRARLAGMLLVLVSAGASAQELYRLEANDRIEVWTTQEPSLQRTAMIGPDGWLSLPLIGHVRAAGMTTTQLEQTLREKLKGFFKESIDLTVMLQPGEERVQTIYVAGQVNMPGAYPFRPGMTLLHGISMAGGLLPASAATSNEQQILEIRGAIAQDTARLDALDAQIMRVSAELSGQSELSTTETSPSIESERRIFMSRRTEQALLVKARDEALELNERAAETLRERATTQQTRIELAEKRLSAISQLVAKGYTNEAQQLELQSGLAEMQARALELQAQLVETQRTAAAEIARSKTALQERRTGLEIELRNAERDRGDVQERLANSNQRLKLTLAGSPSAPSTRDDHVGFSIVRTVDGRPTSVEATELSNLEPGDLIQVGTSLQVPARRVVSTSGAADTVPNNAVLQ